MAITDLWHEWPTNFSNGTAIDDIGNYIGYANLVTSGFFSAAVLIITWIMVFFAGVMMGVKRSISAACFITFVFSVYFWRIGLVNPTIMFLLAIATIIFAIGAGGQKGGY